MNPIAIPWGKNDEIPLRLPSTWQVIASNPSKYCEPVEGLSNTIRQSLDNPIFSQPLREIVDSKTRIVLVMDDSSRPTPVDRVVPPLLDYLIEAGAVLQNIVGLFSVRTHKVMSPAEMKDRVGSSVFKRIQCVNFDCHQDEEFI